MLSSIKFKLKNNVLGLQTDKKKKYSRTVPNFKVSLGFSVALNSQLTSSVLQASLAFLCEGPGGMIVRNVRAVGLL